MDTNSKLALVDENVFPSDDVIALALGETHPLYQGLLKVLEKHNIGTEWRYYKDGKAWLCKCQYKKKTIVWLSAFEGYIQAGIYVPLRLLDQIIGVDFSAVQKEKIQSTKNVGKTQPLIFDVKSSEVLVDLEKAVVFKLAAR